MAYSSRLYDPAIDAFRRGPKARLSDVADTAIAIPWGPKARWIVLASADEVYLYDSLTSDISRAATRIYDLNYSTATLIPSGPNAGKILFAGGANGSPNSTQIYDPSADRFAPGPKMNVGRCEHTATLISAGPNAGRILIVGGRPQNDPPPLASTELYDPATNSFASKNATPTLITARAAQAETWIPLAPNKGEILVTGGWTKHFEVLASTEIYDPATNRFRPGPEMNQPHVGHSAILIPTGPSAGRVLIVGGVVCRSHNASTCAREEASTEIYDPLANKFIPGPRTSSVKGDVFAVQLPEGPFPRSQASARASGRAPAQ